MTERVDTPRCNLSLPWGCLAYTDTGQTGLPAAIFLHGSGCDAQDWAGVLAALSTGFRRICLDFRGHGLSHVPAAPFSLHDLAGDVEALIEHLALACPLLVGHSLGGMVALDLAWSRGAGLAGLVLLEGWTSLAAAEAAFQGERFYGRLDPLAIDRIRMKREQTVARFAPGAWQTFWHSVETFDARDILHSARLPIYEVYGALGRTETTPARLQVPDQPSVHWRWIEGAGHYLPLERPEEIAQVIEDAFVAAVMKIKELISSS